MLKSGMVIDSGFLRARWGANVMIVSVQRCHLPRQAGESKEGGTCNRS